MKYSVFPWRVRAPLHHTRVVMDERWGVCIEVYSPQPMWRRLLDWCLCGLFAGILVMAQLLASAYHAQHEPERVDQGHQAE